MKFRPFFVLLLSIAAAPPVSFAAAEQPRQRYLVATRQEPTAARFPLLESGIFARFQAVRGFAAELTEQEAEALRHSPDVRFIEPDLKRYLISSTTSFATRETESQAEERPQTLPYGIPLLRAQELWSLGTGAGIRVGIVDTGIDLTHPDLAPNYKGGRDFINNDDDPQDGNGHGTHVAGTVAAANNQVGVAGIAPDAELFALKILNDEGEIPDAIFVRTIIDVVDWAIANRLHILNLSLGCGDPADPGCRASELEKEAFESAAAAGILVVAASGNGYDQLNSDFVSFPAAYPSVLAVGAVDRNQIIGGFSQRGAELDLVAPGVAVLSTVRVGTGSLTDFRVGSESHEGVLMEGSPVGEERGHFVFAGLGRPEDFPASTPGRIALIHRGELTFADKARNAKNAGATAVVVINNIPGEIDFTPTLGAEIFEWPLCIMITKEAGENVLGKGDVEVIAGSRADDYGKSSGTSMASPHVAGVAALIWSIAPNATAQQVRQALLDGALDLGAAGFDTVHGFGLVNAYNSARRLAPELFPTPPRRRSARP